MTAWFAACSTGFYLASGYVAALFLVCIALSILSQVGGRFIGIVIESTEISGFFLAATTYFGLAYTFHSGAHIRINLLIRNVTGPRRKWVELWCCGLGTVVLAYFTYHAMILCWQLYTFGDVSRGLHAVPFWIPEMGMAIGLMMLTIAFADETVRILRGATPSYETAVDSGANVLAGAEPGQGYGEAASGARENRPPDV